MEAIKLEFSAGTITVVDGSGNRTNYAIADILRAVDIPTGLTSTHVATIKALANMLAVLIKTLIEREILDESFMGDEYSLDALVEAIGEMGGNYRLPSLEDANK